MLQMIGSGWGVDLVGIVTAVMLLHSDHLYKKNYILKFCHYTNNSIYPLFGSYYSSVHAVQEKLELRPSSPCLQVRFAIPLCIVQNLLLLVVAHDQVLSEP